ncbi:hypothetical protein H6G89_32015 [Oscillatoria sp. FACHB-1407]|uniref:hypothetical protein n=1 Tax=Oscillatoria sp. FACHB-1407 TaxID=2692847 RepID=UPI0016859CB2|nr:hypothetical protein [Oscillatoria sp. FACHB-1407]MBD2465620.1 hypothetical protein [Oscillatoria sp. FACHB-1407]
MLSTLTKFKHSVSVPVSLPTSAIEQAIQFLKLYNLSDDQQLTIKAAIDEVALQRNCFRQQAAWWLNKKAFPEIY